MQSSFRVIKSSRVVKQGDTVINTRVPYEINEEQKLAGAPASNICSDGTENVEKIDYNPIGNASKEAEEIVNKALAEAESIKQNAYNEGYNAGKEQGYMDGQNEGYNVGQNEGYNAGYNEAFNNIKAEEEAIMSNANSVLNQAKDEYNGYLDGKNDEIKNVILSITKKILKREVSNPDALNEMIYEVLEAIKNTKVITIKCSNIYFEELKSKAELWKETLANKADIFVVQDNSVEDGNAVIEKDNGKTVVGINFAMEKIEEIFNEN